MARILLLTAVCLSLVGCRGSSGHDARLTAINDSTGVNPEWAVAALKKLDAATLSDDDRHFYDLLTVKASDKAYIRHTSDSLILSTIEYYRDNDTDLLPEALYYGGRVNSDLGDYPAALSYFQDALDITPEEDTDLRARINSQTGRLLGAVRQFHQSIPYLKEALRLDSLKKDTFAIAFNHQLLGATYIDVNDFEAAEYHIDRAVDYARSLNEVDQADINIYRASMEYHTGHNAAAAEIIRENLDKVTETFKWLALTYACDIYYDAQKYDSVYYFARQLCYAPIDQNQKSGYKFLFKPQVKKYLPADSVEIFLEQYKQVIEEYLHTHDAESTLLQNARYNYNTHLQKRIQAENSNSICRSSFP